jgi:NADH dehydrogenase (ubiquinone) 1 alpha subcomplex subunit 5
MRFTALLKQAADVAGKTPVLIRAAKGNPTGLTGIYQHPNPRPALISLYKATLQELSERFPADSIYRQSVENLTKSRLAIVESNEVIEKIENQIGCGLIEEVVIQANEELELLKKMAEWKVWEPLQEQPLEDQWVYFGKKV